VVRVEAPVAGRCGIGFHIENYLVFPPEPMRGDWARRTDPIGPENAHSTADDDS
jgi:hypothetical protein